MYQANMDGHGDKKVILMANPNKGYLAKNEITVFNHSRERSDLARTRVNGMGEFGIKNSSQDPYGARRPRPHKIRDGATAPRMATDAWTSSELHTSAQEENSIQRKTTVASSVVVAGRPRQPLIGFHTVW
jgi:hypothetical protein